MKFLSFFSSFTLCWTATRKSSVWAKLWWEEGYGCWFPIPYLFLLSSFGMSHDVSSSLIISLIHFTAWLVGVYIDYNYYFSLLLIIWYYSLNTHTSLAVRIIISTNFKSIIYHRKYSFVNNINFLSIFKEYF